MPRTCACSALCGRFSIVCRRRRPLRRLAPASLDSDGRHQGPARASRALACRDDADPTVTARPCSGGDLHRADHRGGGHRPWSRLFRAHPDPLPTWNDRDNLREVTEALTEYATLNQRLPCPALGTADTGLEDDSTGNVNCNSADGVVPWATLSCVACFLDGWGRKISYRVYSGASGLTQPRGASMVNCNASSPVMRLSTRRSSRKPVQAGGRVPAIRISSTEHARSVSQDSKHTRNQPPRSQPPSQSS